MFESKKKIIMCMLIAITAMTLTACSMESNKKVMQKVVNGTPASTSDVKATDTIIGLVKKTDINKSQITIIEPDSGVEAVLNYNAASVITNKFGNEIEGEEVQVGQIFEASYTVGEAEIVTMNVPKDAWEYQDVASFSFDRDAKTLHMAGTKFKYTEATYYIEGDKQIQLMEINEKDKITVRGIGVKVYSVVKTAGHGYIKLTNYSDFKGGTLTIGNGIVVPVTDNMLITVGVGSYRVTISKNKAYASKNVVVKDNQEAVVDFSDFVPDKKNIGKIKFNIDPKGADVYLNGTMVDYTEPIYLNYGKYKLVVSLTGYTTYSGILNVQDEENTINISLIEEDASVSSSSAPTSTPSPSPTSNGNTSSSSDDEAKKVDESHTITVEGPEGAGVYLDNVYQGTAPCTFTKIIGTQTITLSQSGHVSKSYTVNILDNNKDIKLSFSELEEASEDD